MHGRVEGARAKCAVAGCSEPGDRPAPKSPNSRERWYFCERHAAEYNRNWNYFEGLTAEEAAKREAEERRDADGFGQAKFYGWGGPGDGNLVLYRVSDGRPLWYTATPGPAGEAAMQGDGNFVVYSSGGQPQWSTGTVGHEGAWLAVQSDGNLVIYDAYGYPLWWRQ